MKRSSSISSKVTCGIDGSNISLSSTGICFFESLKMFIFCLISGSSSKSSKNSLYALKKKSSLKTSFTDRAPNWSFSRVNTESLYRAQGQVTYLFSVLMLITSSARCFNLHNRARRRADLSWP